MSLQRFPEGIDGEQFFSKNPPKGAPDYVRSVMVVYPSARSHPQLVIDEPAAAVWAVQMNTVVFHPWPSRAENSDNPDQLRIDLDPQPGTDFDDAIPAAIELRTVLRGGRASTRSSRPRATAACTCSRRSSRPTSSWMCGTR